MRTIFSELLLCLIVIAFTSISNLQAQTKQPIRNVVLVHGAFLDGSGWGAVYNELSDAGYNVSITQHTLQSLETDVAAVNRIIDQQEGPVILVGHSYGGVVISEAGNNPKVMGLVYIAAHMPAANETRAELFKQFPPLYKSLIKGKDGFDYIDPEKFPEDFAGGVPLKKAKFMAYSQVPTADICFQATVNNPAWKIKPVWYMVAKADRIINPDLEKFYAERAKAKKTVQIENASHSVFITHPKEVSNLIMEASNSIDVKK